MTEVLIISFYKIYSNYHEIQWPIPYFHYKCVYYVSGQSISNKHLKTSSNAVRARHSFGFPALCEGSLVTPNICKHNISVTTETLQECVTQNVLASIEPNVVRAHHSFSKGYLVLPDIKEHNISVKITTKLNTA